MLWLTIWYTHPCGNRIALTQSQGHDGPGDAVDYSVFEPFDLSSYFHPYCLISDYDNQTDVENCWLGDTTVSLPDLNTKDAKVREIWYDWVADLVSNYSSMSDSFRSSRNSA